MRTKESKMNIETNKFSNKKNYIFIIKPDDMVLSGEEIYSTEIYEKVKAGLDGGYLETVPYLNKFMGRSCIAFCDENGKSKGLKPNLLAQEIWQESYGRLITEDHLVGNIVLIVAPRSFLSQL
jgi:hypothetical protein